MTNILTSMLAESGLAGLWRHEMTQEIIRTTYEHVFLVFVAMLVAVMIALPLGIYLTRARWPRLAGLTMAGAGVIQTIPSLALITFIVILFALVRLRTIGVLPALVALVLYALLPILQNTFTGIRQVDTAMIEVARGMGMKPRQILFQVELPLSLPVIMAGIRIATVWTIGVATLCSLVGAGGLGDPILKGLRSIRVDYMLAGTIPAAAMALLFNFLLGRAEKWLTPAGLRAGGGNRPG